MCVWDVATNDVRPILGVSAGAGFTWVLNGMMAICKLFYGMDEQGKLGTFIELFFRRGRASYLPYIRHSLPQVSLTQLMLSCNE